MNCLFSCACARPRSNGSEIKRSHLAVSIKWGRPCCGCLYKLSPLIFLGGICYDRRMRLLIAMRSLQVSHVRLRGPCIVEQLGAPIQSQRMTWNKVCHICVSLRMTDLTLPGHLPCRLNPNADLLQIIQRLHGAPPRHGR